MRTPDPQGFEDAVGRLWNGKSLESTGFGTMADALTDPEARSYLRSWLRPGRERNELIAARLIYGSKEKQAARALFLTLMAELAERGEGAPTD